MEKLRGEKRELEARSGGVDLAKVKVGGLGRGGGVAQEDVDLAMVNKGGRGRICGMCLTCLSDVILIVRPAQDRPDEKGIP